MGIGSIVISMEKLTESAKQYRDTLPNDNNYSIEELSQMPAYFGWVKCQHFAENEPFVMFLGGNDDGIALRFFWNNSYEKTSLKIWSELSIDSRLIIDVGAHTGVYSLAALTSNKQAEVISFEPNFLNFGRLNLNLRANTFSTKNTFMLGVGKVEENAAFSIPFGFDYLSTGGALGSKDDQLTYSASIVSLDSFLRQDQRSMVDLVKIDTECHEDLVLEGMAGVLLKSRPILLFECIDKEVGTAVKEILLEYDYNFYLVDEVNGKVMPVDEIEPIFGQDGRPVFHLLNRIACPDNKTPSLDILAK